MVEKIEQATHTYADGDSANVFMTSEELAKMGFVSCKSIVDTPKYVGWIVMPGSTPGCETRFATLKKPKWIARKLLKLLMDIGWEDYK